MRPSASAILVSQSPLCHPEPCSAGWRCMLPCCSSCSSCSLLLLGDTPGALTPSCRAPGAFPKSPKCQGGSNRLAQGMQEGQRVNCEKVCLYKWHRNSPVLPGEGLQLLLPLRATCACRGPPPSPQPSVPTGGPWRDPRDDLGAGAEPACTNLCLPLTCVLARRD